VCIITTVIYTSLVLLYNYLSSAVMNIVFTIFCVLCCITLIFYNMNINLLSWNCRGIMSSAFALSEMLDRNHIDIALLTEHTLLLRSNRFLNTIHYI